ncbi:alpha/beta hydrolase fold domain-containing protein [[Actinomadura] parvosata]|uniref:alpha/beta hydrolase fold domain-containing protein n=1 Tax=[Actinomadura] parvosata TaxID=1955412 RepID=UPI00406D1A5E
MNTTTKPTAFAPGPEPVTGLPPSWSSLVLPGVPPVPVRVHLPQDRAPAGLLVWAHGGSWQHGSAAEWHHTTTALAARSGWAVISVDYRLAPHHRHPSAVQDVLAALTWAHDGAPGTPLVVEGARAGTRLAAGGAEAGTRLAAGGAEAGTRLAAGGSKAGIPLAVGGDSAGGTIAAVVALAARDRGLPLAAQVLAYPPFDPDCAAPSYDRSPSAFPQAAALREAWRAWLGDTTATTHDAAAHDIGGGTTVHDADRTRLYATPWQAPTLAGVAPAILAVGRDDPVHDDVVTYARRLHADGVPARLLRPPGARHGDVLRPDRPLLHQLAAALRELTSSP